MSTKKRSKQKNKRHHLNPASSIFKQQSTKAKLRNQDLVTKLDAATGLAGAVNLFSCKPTKPKVNKESKAKTEKALEDDILGLITLQLSTTKAS